MQDRFKFRFWNKSRKIMETFNGFSDAIGDILTNEIKAEPYIIMQSTGLKDKNGKLIYEGDILQQSQLPHKVVCEWYKDGFWLNGFMNGAKRELRNMHNWYEVIGNIYKNPELLEE